MELDQATEQFYEKLSERLKEKGFSTRIIEDGCLEVTSEKIRGKQKTHCAVGRDGEVEQAESCLSEPLPALTGVAILHAYTNGHRNMAKDLIAQCTSEQIAAAPPNLLRLVAERLDFQTAMELVDKGVQPGDYAADVLHTLTGQHQEWMAEKLLEHGMPVAADNYAALYVCVNNQAAGVAKLLLDRGMDLEQYQTWAEKQRKNEGYEETMAELTEYWSELQSGPEQDSPSMDGMSL